MLETKVKFLEEITAINPNYNLDLIGRAFETGRTLHDGQLRKSETVRESEIVKIEGR